MIQIVLNQEVSLSYVLIGINSEVAVRSFFERRQNDEKMMLWFLMITSSSSSSSSSLRTSIGIEQSVISMASSLVMLSLMLAACLYPNGNTILPRLPGVASFQMIPTTVPPTTTTTMWHSSTRIRRRPQQHQLLFVRPLSQLRTTLQLSSNLDDFNEMYDAAEDEEEAQEQATQCIHSLSDYHVGDWTGQATSFSVSPDIAAGILRRKMSLPYTLAVQVSDKTDPTKIAFTETIMWKEEDGSDSSSVRSIPLFTSQSTMDVDDADASYSFDRVHHDYDSTVGLPARLSGTNKECVS